MSLRFVEYRPGVASTLPGALRSYFQNRGTSLLVNYGNGSLRIIESELVLNRPEAVRVCIDKPAALAVLRDGSGSLFVVPAVLNACVVVKHRNHRGGKGHVLVDGETRYAEEFVPCAREWRVHVVGDRTCARLKTGGTGNIRNRRNGWSFTYSDQVPQAVREAAKRAVHLLSLDFGAVDVGEREGATPVVYEVNTAPRLQVDTVLDWYRRYMIRLIDAKLRR